MEIPSSKCTHIYLLGDINFMCFFLQVVLYVGKFQCFLLQRQIVTTKPDTTENHLNYSNFYSGVPINGIKHISTTKYNFNRVLWKCIYLRIIQVYIAVKNMRLS